MHSPALLAFLCLMTLPSVLYARKSQYKPCPLLGSYLPVPQIDTTSPDLQSAFEDFTSYIDGYVHDATGMFGPITPATTTFSVALFAGSNRVKDPSNSSPFFYQYHHTASKSIAAQQNLSPEGGPNSVFAIGDLTQVFTTLMLLVEEGDRAWSTSILEYLPELLVLSNNTDPLRQVDWTDVTLGDLAGHMAGVTRDSGACKIDTPCESPHFIQIMAQTSPVNKPGVTPLYSHAAFQLLAAAMENKLGIPFGAILEDRILKPLHMQNTRLLRSSESLFGDGRGDMSFDGEPASLGLASSITDLSRFGRAILTSRLLDEDQTRRWLSPIADTSNLRNAIGRPWEIYHFGEEWTDPIVDIYTKTGTVGKYSSYFGLVPAYDVGFAILAVDAETGAPDLNAYADIVLGGLAKIDSLGRAQATANLAGTYREGGQPNSVLTIEVMDSEPGLAITAMKSNGSDWLAYLAKKAGIMGTSNLDLRLYPTELESTIKLGRQQVFQAIIQDKSALVDAGTPTCISWMTVGELVRDGQPLDRFIVEFNDHGLAIAVTWTGMSLLYDRPA